MALLEEQFTETLDAGAPDITYQGNEGKEQQIARSLWDQLPNEIRMQFGSFQQFFSSGAWKEVLARLQQAQQQVPERIQETETIQTQPQQGLGSMMPAQMAYGGIAGADGRRQYGIGSWFQKKIMDPIKKNPLVTAAVLGAGSSMIPGLPTSGWIGRALEGVKGKGIGSALGSIMSKPEWMIPAASLVAGAFAKPEQQLEGGAMSRGAGINLQDIAKLANITDEKQGQAIGLNFLPEASARKYSPEEMALTYSQAEGAAHGGRIGYGLGDLVTDFDQPLQQEENIRAKIKQLAEQSASPESFPATDSDFAALAQLSDSPDDFPSTDYDFDVILRIAQEGQWGDPEQQEGGLMSLGGMEMDLRGGGFVPLGAKEKADDVPARLSKNEFVFTADAVRAAGGGDVDAGADKMYNTMKQLESRVG
jgi:hypothetical protein